MKMTKTREQSFKIVKESALCLKTLVNFLSIEDWKKEKHEDDAVIRTARKTLEKNQKKILKLQKRNKMNSLHDYNTSLFLLESVLVAYSSKEKIVPRYVHLKEKYKDFLD